MKPPLHNPNDAGDRSRLILAIVLSLLVLFGFHFLVEKPRQEAARQQKEIALQRMTEQKAVVEQAAGNKIIPRDQAVSSGGRVPVVGDKVRGSISLKGGRLDDLLLNEHYTTVEKTQNIALLSPSGTPDAYYVDSGWLANKTDVVLPGNDTVWRIAAGSPREVKAGAAPVVLQWDNGQGLVFERSFSVDENYLFEVVQRVHNNTGSEIGFNAYHLVSRHSMPRDFSGFFVLHEGPIAFLNDELEEPNYKDLAKGETIEVDKTNGWVGISDKYWSVTLLPEPSSKFNARILADKSGARPVYQADTVSSTIMAAPGKVAEEKSYIYAGAKDLKAMKSYQDKYGFKNLDLSIDFGMWYLITKPFYYLLHFLIHSLGSVALAILLMTVIVRGAVFPLSNKSFISMAKMKTVQPQMKEIQDKYKDDKTKLQMEIYELYKREDVNPFSGCWPMLIQIPIFFALYKVILISVELRHAPFWGWIRDLSAPDPTSVFNLFGLIPWTPPQPLMIGIWPILFCLSMILQKRISPPMADPMQEKLHTYFPYFVTVMLAHFSVGLVIYWTWSNVLGTIQQYYILKKVGGEDTSLIRGHSGRRKKKAPATEEAKKDK